MTWQNGSFVPGKTALVTGAASGIGRAVVFALAERGATALVLVDRDPKALQQTHQDLECRFGKTIQIMPHLGDVTDEGFRQATFDAAYRQFGGLQILVPAAGITRDARAVRRNRDTNQMESYPIADFRLVLEVNLTAAMHWSLELLRRVAEGRRTRGLGKWTCAMEQHEAAIVAVGSVSSDGNDAQMSYAAGKAGLASAVFSIIRDCIYYGVYIGVIEPGFTDTAMVDKIDGKYFAENILPKIPIGRKIAPEEIAHCALFMIETRLVSCLRADGGLTYGTLY